MVLSYTPEAPSLLMLTATGSRAYDLKHQYGKGLLYFLVQDACYIYEDECGWGTDSAFQQGMEGGVDDANGENEVFTSGDSACYAPR